MATILSAQSTDKRVNLTTPALFAKYRGAGDYAGADRSELEALIRPTGFYRNKADSLIRLGRELAERFDGEVPRTIDELVTLPGVGRKTANVILGNAFDVPGITVDTHFGRLVRRWRWTAETDPVKVEHAVGALIERSQWTLLSHRVIFHGRRVCHARKPACGVCVLARDCPSYGTGPVDAALAALLVKGPSGRICWRWPDFRTSRSGTGEHLDALDPGGAGCGGGSDRGHGNACVRRIADARRGRSAACTNPPRGRHRPGAGRAPATSRPATVSGSRRGSRGPEKLRGTIVECAADGSPSMSPVRWPAGLWCSTCGRTGVARALRSCRRWRVTSSRPETR